MKKTISLLLFSSTLILSAQASTNVLERLQGSYQLETHNGDDGQFNDACPQLLNVHLNTFSTRLESNYFSFTHINEGTYRSEGEFGTRKTETLTNKIVNAYSAYKFPASLYREVSSYTLSHDDQLLTITQENSDNDNLECVYTRKN